MKWLRDNGFKMAIAGRTVWGDSETFLKMINEWI